MKTENSQFLVNMKILLDFELFHQDWVIRIQDVENGDRKVWKKNTFLHCQKNFQGFFTSALRKQSLTEYSWDEHYDIILSCIGDICMRRTTAKATREYLPRKAGVCRQYRMQEPYYPQRK